MVSRFDKTTGYLTPPAGLGAEDASPARSRSSVSRAPTSKFSKHLDTSVDPPELVSASSSSHAAGGARPSSSGHADAVPSKDKVSQVGAKASERGGKARGRGRGRRAEPKAKGEAARRPKATAGRKRLSSELDD